MPTLLWMTTNTVAIPPTMRLLPPLRREARPLGSILPPVAMKVWKTVESFRAVYFCARQNQIRHRWNIKEHKDQNLSKISASVQKSLSRTLFSSRGHIHARGWETSRYYWWLSENLGERKSQYLKRQIPLALTVGVGPFFWPPCPPTTTTTTTTSSFPSTAARLCGDGWRWTGFRALRGQVNSLLHLEVWSDLWLCVNGCSPLQEHVALWPWDIHPRWGGGYWTKWRL